MPDEFTLQRSKRLVERYTQLRAELDSSAVGGRFMPTLGGAFLIRCQLHG